MGGGVIVSREFTHWQPAWCVEKNMGYGMRKHCSYPCVTSARSFKCSSSSFHNCENGDLIACHRVVLKNKDNVCKVPCGYKFMANPALEPQILTAHRGLFLVATWFLNQEFPLRERWDVEKIFHRSGTQVKCLYWIIIFEDIWQSSKSQPTIVLKSTVYFFR